MEDAICNFEGNIMEFEKFNASETDSMATANSFAIKHDGHASTLYSCSKHTQMPLYYYYIYRKVFHAARKQQSLISTKYLAIGHRYANIPIIH